MSIVKDKRTVLFFSAAESPAIQLKLLKSHSSWSLLPRDAIRRAAALLQDAYHGTKSAGTFWGLKVFMERSDIICLSSPCTGDQGMGGTHTLLTTMSI